jgi:hypothetical protein
VLFDLTIARKSEGGSSGVPKDFIRFNVAYGQTEDVSLVMYNFNLMGWWFRMIYGTNKPWALYLLDFLDCGDIIDLPPYQSVLPIRKAEYMSGAYSDSELTLGKAGR